MNSADQGVKPMDSAFKRRWDFRYIKIEISNVAHETAIIRYADLDIEWGRLVTLINKKLSDRPFFLDEDKLIGPYFIKPDELGRKQALDKLLLYLWDDVLRHSHNRESFFKSDINSFSKLSDKFETEDVLNILVNERIENINSFDVTEHDDEEYHEDQQE